MADVLIESFDFSKLDKWIKEADKQLALLANHSEEAAKRVNRALSDMGKADLDISAVNSMGQSLLDLKRKLSEINKEAKASTDPTIMGKLSKDSAKTIDDINKVFEAIEKVRKANDATDSVKLSELRAAYAKKKAQFDAGGIVQDIEGSKSIVPYNNVEMQQIIDEMKALKELIRIREMSTQEKINNAAKEAGKEKKIEDDKNKEIIASYKSMLSELSKLASEYSKIRISTYSTGETDDSKALEKNILKRYDELVESKVSLEEKGLDEISLLKEDFERKEQTREIENARKLYQEHKKKYKELAKAKREANQEKNTTVSGAMEFSREAKSISRRTVAIKNLESARNSLNTKDAKNLIIIREINDEIARQKMRIDELTKINKVQKESVSSVKNEYRSLLSEMRSLDRAYQKSMKATMDFGHTEQTDASIRAIMERYNDLRHRRIEIENKYWSEVSDIAAKNEAAMASDSMNRYRNQKNEEKKLFEKNKKKNLKDLAEEYEVESQEDSYEKWAAIASKKAEIRAEEERRLNEETERKKREQQDKNLQSEYDKSIESQNKQLDNSLKNLGKERAAREKYMTDAVTKSKNSIRSEYGQINSEMIRLQDSYEKSLSLSERNGATDKSRKNEKRIYERYSELWGRKLEIEENFEDSVADLRDRYAAEEQRKELERENVKNKRRKSDSEKAAKERQREIEQARLEYKKIFEEIYNSQKSLERAKEGKEKFRESYNAEVNVEAVTNRIKSLNEKKSRLEKEFGYSLYKTRMEVEAKIQRDLIKQEEKNAKKRQDKNEEWLRTTEGATMFSDTAASINEEREAVKLLTAARDNLSRSTQKYDEIVADLNKRIDAHRVSIESKTKSQQQEQTLLPSVRNEYARILKEIDSLRESYIRLKKAEKDSGADLSKDKAAILARWKDIAIAKYNLEKDSQGQLDNIVRKHEAERAKANLEAFIRQEEEKSKIAEEEAEKRAKMQEEEEEEYNNSYEGSLSFSRMSKTAGDESEAIKHLKTARENLSVSDERYREKLERLNGAIRRHERRLELISEKSKKVASAHRGLMDISGQLARRLALVFSVSQITGYINKLASVRGEFELQKKALEAIVKDKDETDKLWNKTVELAVKSPFRVKELVTYTKQLAAYRIEAEKLYDVNKMLADVSAGLGVDMNRLILAFGQVKAANYLRGTELRQFSEAGINVLEELAKYFSEVEGRAIKVGDVFEMVSKRMVSFSDVEEVFHRITSEGGTFYNMQEIQSETLKGQLSNLYDSIDIMLNKIGEDNEGSLKGVVKATREMVENWEEVAFVMKGVIPLFLTINAVNMVYSRGIKTAGTNTLWFSKTLTEMNHIWVGEAAALDKATGRAMEWNKAQRVMIRTTAKVQAAMMGLWGAFKAFAPYLIVAGLVEITRRMTENRRRLNELNESVRNVVNEDISNLEKEKKGYIDLMNRMSKANKGTLERKNIIGRLNSEYGEYLDFVVKENTEVSKLADAYDNVVKRMQNKAALDSLQKSYSVIEENYRKELQGAKDEFYKMFEEGTVKSTKSDKKFDFILPTKKEIDDIYILLQNKIRELKADELDSVKEQQDLLQSIIKGYYGEDYYLGVNYDDIKLLDILLDKKRQEEEIQKEINALYEETLPSREANIALEKLQSEYIQKRKEIEKDKSTTVFEKNKLLSNLADMEKMGIIDIKVRFNIITKEEGEAQKKAIKEWEEETTKSINNAVKNIKGFSEEDLARVLISKDDQTNQSVQEYIKKIKGGWEKQNEIIREQIGLKSQGLDADEESLKNAVKLEELYRKVANLLGIEIGYREPINKSVVEKINAAVSEKFQISELDALSSQDQLLSENNKDLSEHIKKLEMLKNSRLQGQEGLDESIEKEQEYVNVLTLKGQMLGSYNQKLIDQRTIESINAKLSEKYQIKDEDRLKSQKDLLAEAKSAMDDAVSRQDMLNHSKAKGTEINDEEIKQIEEEVKFSTLKWKLLGGNDDEKEKKQRKAREVLEERLRVIKELHEAYKELNKTLSENEAKEGALQKYGDAFRAAYAGTSLKLDDFYTSEQGMKEFYTKLIAYAVDAKDKIRVELAKGEIVLEEKVKFKIESDNNLNEEIEKMFGDYEISLDLESLNVPSDIAKRLFGLDATSLEDLKFNLLSRKDEFIGSDQEQKYKEFLKRIDELEDKSRMERLKKYTSYLVKSRTEAVKIKLEELKQLEEIEDLNYTASEKSFIKNSIRRESRSKMDKIYWEEFKDSSVYLQIFQDLDNASKKSLDGMKERLMDIRDSLKDLSPTELKELISSMNRIDEARFKEDSLFKNLREYINLSRQIEKLDEENRRNIEEEDRLRILVKLQSNYVADKEHEYNLLVKEEGIEGKNARYAKVNLDSGRAQLNNLINELEKQKLITAEVAEQLRLFGKLEETTKGKAQKIIGQIEQAFSSLPKMGEDLQQIFGFDLDQKTKDILDSASAIGGGIANAAMSWMSGDYVGAVTSALGSIAAIFEIGDKKKERAIQREIEYVERLEKQYEKLGEAIDKAYSIDTLKESIRLSDENIKKQIESRKEMIQLEEDKKKTDHDRIKQWNEEIEELQKRQEELHRQQVENMGGTYDYKSAAEEFINAWREAFQETGDGLQGLKGHFKDFEKSLILKQAVMQGAATITKDLMDEINKSLEDDYGIDDGEWNNIDQTKENVFERLDEFLKGFYGQYEGIFDNKGGLSGLQESIQGITEQTAQILEAYLNSVRLFVADTNNKFTRFSDIYFSETENPMLSQLKIIAKQTDAIRRLFDGVVKSGHPQGGTGIKVFLN